MQDNLNEALKGLGNVLVQIQKSEALITPVLDEIKNNAHNVDPQLMSKFNETMSDLNVQKSKLSGLQDSIKNMNI